LRPAKLPSRDRESAVRMPVPFFAFATITATL
jgi:hypothetical protein